MSVSYAKESSKREPAKRTLQNSRKTAKSKSITYASNPDLRKVQHADGLPLPPVLPVLHRRYGPELQLPFTHRMSTIRKGCSLHCLPSSFSNAAGDLRKCRKKLGSMQRLPQNEVNFGFQGLSRRFSSQQSLLSRPFELHSRENVSGKINCLPMHCRSDQKAGNEHGRLISSQKGNVFQLEGATNNAANIRNFCPKQENKPWRRTSTKYPLLQKIVSSEPDL
ncbi:unnamed protein product [Clavelina lepadiformis]|uniref:Uncharacterized protein n=1 Tax=Clavelina lepadiformis TaxID=159417 RepID=A0ABP0FKS3_CLALP